VAVEKFDGGAIRVIREQRQKHQGRLPVREKIAKMSKKSLRRLIFIMQTTRVVLRSMFTATYPAHYPKDGAIVKSDVNGLAQFFRRRRISYVWFLEFQKRGAPHIHWLLSVADITPKFRTDLGCVWASRVVNSEWFKRHAWEEGEYSKEVVKISNVACHPKSLELIRDENGARNYASKYAAKQLQKTVPDDYKNVGRFWGASRDIKASGVLLDVTEDEVEQWLVKNDHPATQLAYTPKYVWGVGTYFRGSDTQTDGLESGPVHT